MTPYDDDLPCVGVIAKKFVDFDIWCFENGYDARDKTTVRYLKSETDFYELPSHWEIVILHPRSPLAKLVKDRIYGHQS